MTAKKQITPRFIVISSIEKITERATYLSYLARRAYTVRDYNQLAVFSESLINLSPFKDIGEFYQALALSKQGAGDIEKARNIFCKLTESPLVQLRAASLLAMGVSEYNRKNYQEASRLFIEAGKVSISENICAPITFVNSQNALSIIQADNGAYSESLKLLQGVEPIVRIIGCYFPAIQGEFYNNYACGFLDFGDTQTALQFNHKALQNPFVSRYPEWLATREDIKEKLNQKTSRSFVSVPSSFMGFNESEANKPEKSEADWRLVIHKTATDPATVLKVRIAMWEGCGDTESISKESGLDICTTNIIFDALKELDALQRTGIN
jgi:hypothetical protein